MNILLRVERCVALSFVLSAVLRVAFRKQLHHYALYFSFHLEP